MSGRVHRTAVTGSRGWPWRGVVWRQLDARWHRTTPEDTMIVRHGGAEKGADLHAHEWVIHTQANPDPRYGSIEEEPVNARWEECVTTCKPIKADGTPHRRPNPGYPHNPTRGTLPDYCPAAGHRRNPDVPAHPDFPVEVLLGFIWDRSPGATKTVEHADKAAVPSDVKRDYSSRYPKT